MCEVDNCFFGGEEQSFINKVRFETVYYCLLFLFVINEPAQVQL